LNPPDVQVFGTLPARSAVSALVERASVAVDG
jgi:hypothetical protein